MRKKVKFDFFHVLVVVILMTLSLVCLLPIINVLAISFSSRDAVAAGKVAFWPVNFTTAAYEYVLQDKGFMKSLIVSVFRVIIGPVLNVVLAILCAYPLSKEENRFYGRKWYVWFFMFTTLFNGGLIPTYMVVKETGLINSFFSMIIPGAVPVAYVIMMMNFFRGLPKELEESALLDGADQWKIMTKIYLPLSKASIATISLFCIVNHWNSWFDGMIYFNNTKGQPLATFLHNMVVNSGVDLLINTSDIDTLNMLMSISNETTKSAQIFLAMIPVLVVYPFMQKYFAKGVVMGSVKG